MSDHRDVVFCNGDISEAQLEWILAQKNMISIDTETTGLDPLSDQLCIIQIGVNDLFFLIRYNENSEMPNLTNILSDGRILKVFHHAAFDLSFLMRNIKGVTISNVVCTKIAAKLLNKHDSSSLKPLLKHYLGIVISKNEQQSEWRQPLSNDQIEYALNDVRYLTSLWSCLKDELQKNNRLWELAEECFAFLPTYTVLSLQGYWNIFEY